MLIIINDYIPKSKIRPGLSLKATSITIHSTANPKSTALNERAWLTNPGNKRIASWHYCVDQKQAICAVPPNEIAWHAGNDVGNSSSIGVEICESGDRQITIRNAVLLVSGLLRERGWGVDRLRRHYDWSKKNCPSIFSANNWLEWEKFKTAVKKELDGGNTMAEEKIIPAWKHEGLDYLVEKGFIEDGKAWEVKLNDSAPIWMVTTILMNIHKSLEGKK